MQRFEGGTFTMGNDALTNSRPVQTVTLSHFWMDGTEVTVDAYASCVTAGPCSPAATGGLCNAGVSGKGAHPINCVSHAQAAAYCAAMGKRLPTEQEWEYAARGADNDLYPWGAAEPGSGSYLCWDRDPWPGTPEGTCQVGSFPAGASPEGLLDLAGNVMEWTSSSWTEEYGATPDSLFAVARGGAWNSGAGYAPATSVSFRFKVGVEQQLTPVGFRCVSDAD
jgi:formylglycine-generating enzyme required for sulfatase activity